MAENTPPSRREHGPWRALLARWDRLDARVVSWLDRLGHPLHRVTLALVFLWFGTLKLYGHPTATTILAHTVFIGQPDVTVRLLGAWEAAIGLCLLFPAMVRIALPLLLLRLLGTAAAMVIRSDVCFANSPLVPTPEGQYLVKDLMLFGAAAVIGGSVRHSRK